MPKQIWKIQNFHGGINSNSDPRDLSPNESPSLQDVSVDSVGRLKTMGKGDSGTLNYNHTGTYSDNFSSDHMILTISQSQYGSGLSTSDNYYNNMFLTFNEGSLAGNSYRIIDYDYETNQTTIKFRNLDGTNLTNLTNSIDDDDFSIYSDGNITSVLKSNRGLFTFGQDRKLDGTESTEFFTFLYDGDALGNIDIKDSTGWSPSYISFQANIEPTFYIADGNVRICDLGFGSDTSKWFGYIPETYFAGLRANTPYGSNNLGWVVDDKDVLTPTKGKCSIGETSVEYSNNSTYKLVGEMTGFPRDKIDEGSLNLQVGVQYDIDLNAGTTFGPKPMPSNRPNDDYSCVVRADTKYRHPSPLSSVTAIANGLARGSGGSGNMGNTTTVCWEEENFVLTESRSLIVPVMFPTLINAGQTSGEQFASFKYLSGDVVIMFSHQPADETNVTNPGYTGDPGLYNPQAEWRFPASDMIGDAWNLLVCTQSNVNEIFTENNGNFEFGKTTKSVSILVEGEQTAPTFLCSPPLLAETVLDGFQPGDYTFYYTNLYDEELQESLPFKFKDVQTERFGGQPNEVDITTSGIQFLSDTDEISTTSIGEGYLNGSLVINERGGTTDGSNQKNEVGWINDSGTIVDANNNNKTNALRVNDSWDMGFSTSKYYSVPILDKNRLNIVGAPILLDFAVYYCGNRTHTCTQTIANSSFNVSHDSSSWGHGLNTGDAIHFTSVGNVTGIEANTVYYVSETKDTVDPVSRFRITTNSSGTAAGNITLGGTSTSITYTSLPNKRVRGSRMYYKTEGNDNFFLIGENDYVKNEFRWLPEGDTLAYNFVDHSVAGSGSVGPVFQYTSKIATIKPTAANLIDTYRSINGFSGHTKSISAQYKTAVVNGRRAYIGNVRQDGKNYPDRIVKSRVGKFDVFPSESGVLDVAIRDGENIIKLEAYADRILQFKENSLYIINVSENVDFLEDTYRNKGCAYDYHVTKTDVGIAWFNKHGAYLYDGQKIHELLEREGLRLLSESYMIDFTTNGGNDTSMTNTIIGYIPKKKNIIIRNANNDVLIYDFVIGSWTKGKSRLSIMNNMTNFALDEDQNIFYIDGINTNRKTWNPSPSSSSNFLYLSADVDFGQPAQRKKIYNVQISYKGNGESIVPKYGVNGTSPDSSFATENLTDGGTSVWTHITLKPTSAINNIYSFQLKLSGTAGADFEINDISIVYRLKSVK